MSDNVSLLALRAQVREVPKKKHRLSFLGVSGEILITVGVLVQLFWVWNVGINDWIQGFTQQQAASATSHQGQEDVGETLGFAKERGESGGHLDDGPPPIEPVADQGAAFATLYAPRFGDDYQRIIAEGVDLETVLNNQRLGVGRYPQSTPLGEEGNFALSGHRTSFGASFGNISELRLGDLLYIETREGWYSYQFRNLEYVRATEVDVLNPVPKRDGVRVTDRIIACAVFDAWFPRDAGPPSKIAHILRVT